MTFRYIYVIIYTYNYAVLLRLIMRILMKIFESYCKNDKKTGCVLAFGNFDGVHSGHRLLLAAAKEYAQKNSLLFGVYTFADSPKFANAHHSVLTTLETRLSLLESAVSPDFVYLEKFDEVKSLRPDEFADYIIEKFGCECTFCGENFRFGKMLKVILKFCRNL